jgi:membrane protein insertase Oxa1/YidC/SpoIIIJ
MAPPKDPLKVLTEQEQISASLVNNLPFVIAFFSLNVPAGLAVYWIINNILTTGINLIVKSNLKGNYVINFMFTFFTYAFLAGLHYLCGR